MMVHELGGRASQPNVRPIPLFKIFKGTGQGSELPNSLRFGHAPDTRIAEMRSELPRIAHELPPELPKSWSVMQPQLVSHSCPDDTFRARSRGAALMYAENGGAFSVDVVRDDVDGAVEMEVPKIAKHQVLKGNFRLQSQAFMLTYHSREFSGRVWPEFELFVKGLSAYHACRAWAACLETGTTTEVRGRCPSSPVCAPRGATPLIAKVAASDEPY